MVDPCQRPLPCLGLMALLSVITGLHSTKPLSLGLIVQAHAVIVFSSPSVSDAKACEGCMAFGAANRTVHFQWAGGCVLVRRASLSEPSRHWLENEKEDQVSRQHSLLKTAKRLLAKEKGFAPSTRRIHQSTLMLCLKDLASLRSLPSRLEQLTGTHVQQLVHYYREKGNTDQTLRNKLGVLRHFVEVAQLPTRIPSNEALGISAATISKTRQTKPLPVLHHPVTRNLIDLQCLFGLTRFEAMRLPLDLFKDTDEQLRIDRLVAHNHKDRQIPITQAAQRDCLLARQQLPSQFPSMVHPRAFPILNQLYQSECRLADIDPKTAFRQRYALTRFDALIQENSEGQALQVLCQEMGCCDRYLMRKEWLNELTTA